MTMKTVSVAILSAAALAACQPGVGVTPDIDTLLGADIPEMPADEALAAMCAGDPALQQEMAEAVNAARTAEGKVLLDPNEKLTEIAQSHACDVAATGRATVAGSNGSSIVDRARAVGYPPCGVAQLVSVGGTPAGVVAGWLGSDPHRVELLGQSSEEIGTGVVRGADGRLWWSVVLGNDCT